MIDQETSTATESPPSADLISFEQLGGSKALFGRIRRNGIFTNTLFVFLVSGTIFYLTAAQSLISLFVPPLTLLLLTPLIHLFMHGFMRRRNVFLMDLIDRKGEFALTDEQFRQASEALLKAPWMAIQRVAAVWLIVGPPLFYLCYSLVPGAPVTIAQTLIPALLWMPFVFTTMLLRFEEILSPYVQTVFRSRGITSLDSPYALSAQKKFLLMQILCGPYLFLMYLVFAELRVSAMGVPDFDALLPLHIFFACIYIGGCAFSYTYSGRTFAKPLAALLGVLKGETPLTTSPGRVDEWLVASELLRQKAEAENERKKIERLKQEFFAMISHELRTPLTAVRSFLSLLQKGIYGEVSENAQARCQGAMSNVDRLIKLISDLLDAEKLEAGQFECIPVQTSVQEIVERALDGVSSISAEQGVQLRVETCQAELVVDTDRIVQVLINLLGNALKFSDGKPVELKAVENDTEVEFIVQDHGTGISDESKLLVFEKFRQVGKSRERGKGTGLGLAIARALVEQHGGTIGVKDTEGGGATFWFKLPRK